jgi:hypothetical protein
MEPDCLDKRHPSHKKDPWNNPLPEGVLEDMAGKPLTKGNHRCAVWAIQGDQEFYSNVLKLGHWSSKRPCHECDCQKATFKKTPCPLGKSWKIIKQEEQQFEYISPQQALLAKRSNHPLFTIPGVSTSLVRGDALHEVLGHTLQGLFCIIFATLIGQRDRQSIQVKDCSSSLRKSKNSTH